VVKKSLFLVSCVFISFFISTKALANYYGNPVRPIVAQPNLKADSYILIDYYSGQVLNEKLSNERFEPASLTKMMTMYVVDTEIKNGMLKLNEKVKVSKKAWQVEGSRMFLEVNSRVPVSEIIRGIVIQSANDSAISIAEHIAGSEEAFAAQMNAYARALGMHNTNFVNSTGINHPDHYSTAADMAKLSAAIIRDFPNSYKIYSEKEYTYNNIRQINRNRLLWRNRYCDGLKTGYTSRSGYSISASAKKDSMRLIAVVLGTKSDEDRAIESNQLLTWGLRYFDTHKLFDSKQKLTDTRVWLGKTKKCNLGVEKPIYVTIPHGQYSKLKAEIDISKSIRAPIEKGSVLGTFSVQLGGTEILSEPLVALNHVKRADAIKRGADYVALSFNSIIDKIKN